MGTSLKEIAESVIDVHNQQRLEADKARFLIYNGKVRDVVEQAIRKEFQKPETVSQLIQRIVPLNITQKIIQKLAGVYQQKPVRRPIDQNEADQILINLYEDSFQINQKMKFANRWFKLFKHCALEPFVDRDGIPRMRALASPMYTPFSDDPIQPERMTAFVKHIKMDTHDVHQMRLEVWTDEEFYIVDGAGNIVLEEMRALDNLEGVNPFGVIPFTYISEADDGNLIPISDDDLVNMQITINLLLTDLAFASKFQLWSIIAVRGAENQNISMNPNSILSLPEGSQIDVIKPELDVNEALAMIEALIGLLLTTKNLSVGNVAVKLEGGANAASGVAKMLDSAETTEDRKDQQEFFRQGEKRFWDKFAHKLLPTYVRQQVLNPEYVQAFTNDFELSIRYADPKPFIGDKDTVDLEIKKLDNKLTTQEMALQVIHPDKDSEEVERLLNDINQDSAQKMARLQEALAGGSNVELQEDPSGDQGNREGAS